MSLNWREIDAILEELPLADSHLQDVRQPDYRSLVLSLYRPRYRYHVLVCLETGATRLHGIGELPEKNSRKPRFVQFLLSRLRGARIVAAGQIGAQRIVRVDVRRGDVESIIWIRLWGGAANVVVTDSEGVILDAFYRRPNRGEVTGGTFWAEESDFGEPRKEFRVRDLPGQGSFNDRVGRFYAQEEGRKERDRLLSIIERQINQEENRLTTRLRGLEDRAASFAEPQRQKELGDIIMANLHRLKPGDRWLTATRFGTDETVEIAVDPRLEPHENAERYYHRYKKAHAGRKQTEQELANVRRRLSELAERRLDAHAAAEQAAAERSIEALRAMVAAEREEKKDLDSGVPGLQFRSGLFRILVGRNSRESDELLRRFAKGNDMWIHTRDVAGGFVFIKHIPGKSVPLETLLDAAHLAVYFSKGRRAGRADLYYTHVKYLRRAKGGKRGLVLPTQEKNLSVDIEEERIGRLLSRSN